MFKYASLVHTYIASHKATSQLVNNFIYTVPCSTVMMYRKVHACDTTVLWSHPTAFDHRTFCCTLTLI